MKIYITDTKETKSIECLDEPFGLDNAELVLEMFAPKCNADVVKKGTGHYAYLTNEQFDFFADRSNLSTIIKAIWGIETKQVVE